MSIVADQPQLDHRVALGAVVPIDYLAWVRRTALTIFCVYAIVWTRDNGILWDRLGIARAVAVFLVCAFVGRPARQWGILAIDLVVVLRDVVRVRDNAWRCRRQDLRDQVPVAGPVGAQHRSVLVLRQRSERRAAEVTSGKQRVHWYDKVASLTYFTHFIFVPIVMGALWATTHRQWARFMKRFATVLGVACLMFIVLPTVPPWMAAKQLPPASHRSRRSAGRGFTAMGLHAAAVSWKNALDWGNAVAAMPSLHASFALIVPSLLPAVDQAALAEGRRAAVPRHHADVAGLLGRALGDRRVGRLGDRRWFVLVLEPLRGSSATQPSAACLGHAVMNPPSTLLDQSFLLAVVDGDDDNHDEAVAIYRTLIDDFVAQRCLLVARADHLKARRQPRSVRADRQAACRSPAPHTPQRHSSSATGVGPDQAITLVLIQRYRIRKLATFDVQMMATTSTSSTASTRRRTSPAPTSTAHASMTDARVRDERV